MPGKKADTRFMCLHRNIWNDDKFPFVSDACQLVFFHVISNPFGWLGIYKASVEALAAEKRKELKDYRKGFDEGIREGFYEYDEKYHVIYIPRFQEYNPPQSPNVVKSFGRQFNEVPKCPLKQKYYDAFKQQMEDLGEAFLEVFLRVFVEPFPEGLPEGLPKASSIVIVNDMSLSNPSSSLEDKRSKDSIVTTTVPGLRRFTDMTQNLVDLWNELVAPLGLSHVEKLFESRARKIAKAYKDVDSKNGWVAILDEYRQSLFLQGKVGADGHGAKDFDWMLSNGKDGTENYLKVQAGRYRDKQSNGLSDTTQRNLTAAQEILAERAQRRQEALNDGNARGTDLSSSTITLSRGDWYTAEQGTPGDIPGGSGDISTGEGPGSADLVGEEFERLPEDSPAAEILGG